MYMILVMWLRKKHPKIITKKENRKGGWQSTAEAVGNVICIAGVLEGCLQPVHKVHEEIFHRQTAGGSTRLFWISSACYFCIFLTLLVTLSSIEPWN